MPSFARPEIPVILTKKDWDKRKGVIAKMAGPTGIGAQCEKVAQAYRAVNWDRFQLRARVDRDLENWRSPKYTKANWDRIIDESKAETIGNLAKLSVALLKLADMCSKTAAEWKKSKTIPSSSTAHVAQMAKQADWLGIQLNKNSMGTVLRDLIKDMNSINERQFGQVVPSIRTVSQKQANLIAQMRQDPTPATFNKLGDQLRELTQSIGNYAKMCERGFAPKNPAATAAFEGIKPYAAIGNFQLPASATREQVLAAIDKLARPHQAALRFAATVR